MQSQQTWPLAHQWSFSLQGLVGESAGHWPPFVGLLHLLGDVHGSENVFWGDSSEWTIQMRLTLLVEFLMSGGVLALGGRVARLWQARGERVVESDASHIFAPCVLLANRNIQPTPC